MASIVLIEDNKEAGFDVALTLTRAGHVVRSASDGGSGVDLLRRWKTEVVIADLSVPKARELDWLLALSPRSPLPAIILLTDLRDACHHDHPAIVGVLTKPFRREAILALVADAVGPLHRAA